MDRLRATMEAVAASHPHGSLEAVAAVGQAYVDFAKAEPGVFRLVFGLTEGHENAPDLLAKGEGCFGVVVHAVAACLGLFPDDADVQRRAYMLWSFVHGHSFLTIDMKHNVASAEIDYWSYQMAISRAILGPTAQA